MEDHAYGSMKRISFELLAWTPDGPQRFQPGSDVRTQYRIEHRAKVLLVRVNQLYFGPILDRTRIEYILNFSAVRLPTETIVIVARAPD